MLRFILRRLLLIPVALLVINFLGYTYAHVARPIRAARTPYHAMLPESGPLLPSYWEYLKHGVQLDLGELPGSGDSVGTAVIKAVGASLGLLGLTLAISVLVGVVLGFRAVKSDPPRVARWMTFVSTTGLAMPSFFIGSLLILGVFFYIVWRPGTGLPLPIQGFGWDKHLVLPVIALMARPAVQIAQMNSELLAGELQKQYIVTARSLGHSWRTVRRRHALRNVLAPMVLTVAGSIRLLVGELILVEWLFKWPGIGFLLASTLIPGQLSTALGSESFLEPRVVATVLTMFAALFLLTDFVASVIVRSIDPRLRAPGEEVVNV
jgi:peptide/nickel transport system permease protein